MTYLVDKIAIPFMEDKFLHRFKSGKKDEFVFMWKDIQQSTLHTNATEAIRSASLIKSVDYVKATKASHPELFKELTKLELVGQRAGSVYCFYESGFWKLAMISRKEAGIGLRHWLATDVLPSIRKSGSYHMGSHLTPEELLIHLDETTQKENSKAINADNYEKGGVPSIIDYNKANCKQVTGKSPSEIKNGSYKSAKQILRETRPELASTMSLNDHLVLKKEVPLEELKQLDIAAINLFKEFNKLGIRVTDSSSLSS